MAERNADAKAKAMAEALLLGAQLFHFLTHRYGQPNSIARRIIDWDRIVEDHHDPVACPLIDAAAVFIDQV